MKKNRLRSILAAASALVLCAAAAVLVSQEQTWPEASARLTVFHPSRGSLLSLMELRNQGFLSLKKVDVVGVYHARDREDMEESLAYVRDSGIDWIRFREIGEEVAVEDLFGQNSWTDDFQAIFEPSDGIIFFGGADVPPAVYGEKTSFLTVIETPFRSRLETSFIFHLLGGYQEPGYRPLIESRPNLPVLGICLGMQSLNVGTGGTLVQDIWQSVYGKTSLEEAIELGRENWHNNPWAKLRPEMGMLRYNLHRIRFDPAGLFVRGWGFGASETPFVMSSHHQMAGLPGLGLRVIATSLDGRVVEAVEHVKYPHVLGVQFHPEFPMLWDEERTFRITPADPETSTPAFLRGNPPSLDFQRRIWSWFSERLWDEHLARPMRPGHEEGLGHDRK